ncbi:MAG TPA: hypothetical protein VF329_06650 [Gammaproteobacteria bacterium]
MAVSTQEHELIREQAAKIAASGALGRSRSYARLLEFLVACSLEGRTPKEHEIATTVFNRGADFDPGQDSMVRVYAHHLRQKLENYYATAGREEPARIVIPKGEYRVVVAPIEPEEAQPAGEQAGREVPRERGRRRTVAWAAAAAVVALGVGALIGWSAAEREVVTPIDGVADTDLWRAVLDDSTPALIVVGDYYIFGEMDETGNVDRLIRNFSINSSRDLDEFIMFEPDIASRYIDLDLTYLPRGAAFALRDVLRVLFTAGKAVSVASMSELDAADLRSNHVIYIGYVSALDKLYDFVFGASGLAVGETYDELIERDTGKLYLSEGGMPSIHRNYRDYGLFSTFPGPGGMQFMIVAGTRDAGLMQTAYAITDAEHLAALEKTVGKPAIGPAPSFEVLYEVSGLDRTNLDAVIVYSSARERAPD